MGFSTALSGLNAAAKDLQVTGNNIANANTTGFKQSRTEFVDVYAASVNGVSKTQAGAGVRVSNVAQQFNQGNLDFTENNLDLAISGEGFFSLAKDPAAPGPTLFTRAGEFKLDKDGFVVSNQGDFLMSFAPNGLTIDEGFSEGVFNPLKINSSQGAPVATTELAQSVNLDAEQVVPANAPENAADTTLVDPTDPQSYNHTSSISIYDSQGNSHIVSTYYVTDKKADGTGTANQWRAYLFIDGVAINADATIPDAAATPAVPHKSTSMTFDNTGKLLTPADVIPVGPILSTTIDPALTVAPFDFDLNLADSTQFSTGFSVLGLSQDGLPAGNLIGININDEGVVSTQFSNGGSEILGKIALTRFANPQGLTKVGDTSWRQSAASGEKVPGQPGTGSFGLIQSGALESSNVDISTQLVKLIIAQQAYQANAQTITTEKDIVQTILNA